MATTLSTLDRASKGEAFGTVLSLKRGEAASDRDIDKLLNFFAPALPKKAKSAEQWVGLACNLKGVRPFERYVHVKDGVATACDGHRAHWAGTYLPDGTYCPKTQLKVEWDGALPDFERVKRDNSTLSEFPLKDATAGQLMQRGKPVQITTLGEGGAVIARYLAAATNGDMTLTVFAELTPNTSERARDSGCSGSSEFGEFVIMGLRT